MTKLHMQSILYKNLSNILKTMELDRTEIESRANRFGREVTADEKNEVKENSDSLLIELSVLVRFAEEAEIITKSDASDWEYEADKLHEKCNDWSKKFTSHYAL